MATNVIPFISRSNSLNKWIVLCDGKRLQIFSQEIDDGESLQALFEEPLNLEQLRHELVWHYHHMPQSGNFIQHVRALLVQAYQHKIYYSLIIVSPTRIYNELSQILPQVIRKKDQKNYPERLDLLSKRSA